jgi:hypothetical protein
MKKAKIKGVRYIANSLRKYQKRKYPNYRYALEQAKIINAQLVKDKKNVTLRNIWSISRGKPKRSRPYIDPFLLQPNPYFTLLDYDFYIKRCSNNVVFQSTLSPSTLEDIQGGSSIDSEEYFLDFIRYCNILKAQTNSEEDRYISEWQILCTQPYKVKGVWTSTIISVNEKGEQTNYGFNPDQPSAEPQPYKPEPKPEPTEPKKVKKPTKIKKEKEQPKPTEKEDSSERAKEIGRIIDGLREDVKAGLISKKDYAKKVDLLLSKLKKGGQV